MRDDDDLPVLSAVVRDGDAAVIRSMRLDATHADAADEPSKAAPRPARGGRGAAKAPDIARIDLEHAPCELDDTLPLDDEAGAFVRHASTGASAEDPSRGRRDGGAGGPGAGARGIDVDDLVDRIVDRHVAALRRDVRDALERALGLIDD